MFKKYLIYVLTIILSIHFSIFAQTSNDKDLRLILKVKNTVAKVGTEPNRKIKVKLKDGTKLKGYITEIKDDNFALLDTKSGKVISVNYAQVLEAKRDGLSKLAVSLIGAGALFGGLFALTFIGLRGN